MTLPAQRTIAPGVFFPAGAITFSVVGFTLAAPEAAEKIFGSATGWIVSHLGWLFHFTVSAALIACVAMPWGARGRLVLGKPGDKPEFGTLSWLAMLFSAGMGIGLLFFGVAEPLMHFDAPPWGAGGSAEAARIAMGTTFFHWGFHAWAIYVLLSLSLAYHGFRKGLPFSVRSALHPFLGRKIHGAWGDIADLLAVFGTIFGLATSLGLGAAQIGSGLHHLFGWENSSGLQVLLIACITGAATLSLLSGLKKGIRLLSEVTVGLAFVLLLFVILTGGASWAELPTACVNYARQVFYVLAHSDRAGSDDWQASWTVFYWAWWIAWAPFVGTFIARISKGRTVREFVAGVLLVPVAVTLVWLFVFGQTALQLEQTSPESLLAVVNKDSSLSLYALLSHLPFSAVTSVIALACVALFFVTSSDSGSFVVDVLTSGGHPDPPRWQRVFWAVTEGLVAAALLWGGGLKALQGAAIATGLPFALVLLVAAVGLFKALRKETTD